MRDITPSHISTTGGRQGSPAIDESWNRNAALWIAAVRGGHIPSRIRVTDAAVFDAVVRLGPGHVLDVGCGEGWLARRLSARCRVTGFDISDELVAAARRACPQGEFRVLTYTEFVGGTGLGPFDLAVANFSLFEQDLLPLAQAIRRALVPGGHFVIQTLHPAAAAEGWQTESFATLASLGDWKPMPWFSRSQSAWVELLDQAGFADILIEEPAAEGDARPASLLLTARASSHGTEMPAPQSTRA